MRRERFYHESTGHRISGEGKDAGEKGGKLIQADKEVGGYLENAFLPPVRAQPGTEKERTEGETNVRFLSVKARDIRKRRGGSFI